MVSWNNHRILWFQRSFWTRAMRRWNNKITVTGRVILLQNLRIIIHYPTRVYIIPSNIANFFEVCFQKRFSPCHRLVLQLVLLIYLLPVSPHGHEQFKVQVSQCMTKRDLWMTSYDKPQKRRNGVIGVCFIVRTSTSTVLLQNIT